MNTRKSLLMLFCVGLFLSSDLFADTSPNEFAFTVQKDEASPLAGVKCYVFDGSGKYLGLYASTDSGGLALLSLSNGAYRFRVDYLGYQFWSDLYAVPTTLSGTMTISHQDISITVLGVSMGSLPLGGLKVYLFNAAGAYQGQSRVTDSNGQVHFSLPDRAYKVRVDYMGKQFWSDVFVFQNTTVSIPIAKAEIAVLNAGAPVAKVKVYVFSPSGSYLGVSGLTDENGKVIFNIAEGEYQFRADYQGNQYWSEKKNLIESIPILVEICTGGGVFTLQVLKGTAAPIEGAKCHLFNEAGSYLGMTAQTGSSGTVSFNLADGNYKMRIDYLGHQFWTGPYAVPTDLSAEMTIAHQDVMITVQGKCQTLVPLPGLKVYLFTSDGAYQGLSQITDCNGNVNFNLPGEAYKVRVDYLEEQFWSEVFQSENTTVAIPLEQTAVSVTGAEGPLSGVKVYVFSETGSYLGVSETTDAEGKASFTLVDGEYRFRVDYQGSQFWSETSGPGNPVAISTGGGKFELQVLKGMADPMIGVPCYVFKDSGEYLGMSAATDGSGSVSYNLAAGSYIFRVDYLGYQFWSSPHVVPASLFGQMTIPHQEVWISVNGTAQGSLPLAGLKVYLFSELGSYQGQSAVTDESGKVSFSLPGQPYQVRVDFLGKHFWSDVFVSRDTTVDIPMAEAEVTVSAPKGPLSGVKVYVFSPSGAFLGLSATTDADGKAAFSLAEGEYTFRADYQGNKFWSDLAEILAGEVNRVDVLTSGTLLVAGDGKAGSQFGASVSLSEEFALIGAPGHDSQYEDGGSAYIFSHASPWTEYGKIVSSDSEVGDQFGASVSLCQNFAIVGARGDDDLGTDSGSAYIFHHDGGNWIEKSKLTAADGKAGDHFGCSVSITSGFAVVGADTYDGGGGGGWDGSHVAEFQGAFMELWSGECWASYYGDFTLTPTGTWAEGYRPSKLRLTYNTKFPLEYVSVRDATGKIVFGERFGYLSGEELELNCTADIGQLRIIPIFRDFPNFFGIEFHIPGEPGGVDSGAAYIFKFDGTVWTEQAKLLPDDSQVADYFGVSVSVDGDYAIIGAPGKDHAAVDSGSAYIYNWDGSTWVKQTKLVGNDTQAGDRFGASVAVSGDYAVVGSDCNSERALNAGAAYIYRRYGSLWNQEAKLTAADAASGDHFGASVAIDGSYVLIGASGSDNKGTDSGTVYLFRREGARWVQQSKYSLPRGDEADDFGASVAICNGTIAAGARKSDSQGTDSGSAGAYDIDSYHDARLRIHPETIPLGGSATLSWSSINADSAAVSPDIGSAPPNGSLSVSPTLTTTYLLTATGSYGTDTYDVTLRVDQPPKLSLVEPDGIGDRIHNRFTIQWTDEDDEENALISLYYDKTGTGANGVLIASGLQEDPDGPSGDTYLWDTSELAEGLYFVYAIIDDSVNDPVVVYSANPLIVDHGLYPQKRLLFSGYGYSDRIGSSVAVSGDYAVIGASGDGSRGKAAAGAAYMFQRKNGNWMQICKIFASDADSCKYFGRSVAISGDYVLVGAYGSVYFFRREGLSWIEQAKFHYTDFGLGMSFGCSVSMDGEYAIVGSPGGISAVCLFKRNASSWHQEAMLSPIDLSPDAHFGTSVDIHDDYIIVGANFDTAEQLGGSAYIYKREGENWIQQAKLIGSDIGMCDEFGLAVSINENYAVVGAPHTDWYPEDAPAPGSAYIFRREGSTWKEHVKLVPPKSTEEDHFGYSVCLHGQTAVVLAANGYYDDFGRAIGSAHVYQLEGPFCRNTVELIPNPPATGLSSVALDRAELLVGAPNFFPSGSVYAYSLIPVSLSVNTERILLGGSAIISWNCIDATTVTIDNGIGAVPAQGSCTVTPAVTTTYTLTAQGPWGTYDDAITLTVVPLTIAIEAPAEAATVQGDSIMVEGTISDAPGFEIGVNVNGVLAVVDGDRFASNHVLLREGPNQIIATASDTFGNTATASIVVNAETAADYLRLTIEPESGIATLEATLKIEASFPFETSEVDYTGPGIVQFISNPTPSEYHVLIATPGLYVFSVEVIDSENKCRADTVSVRVLSFETLDQLLKSKWNQMRTALIKEDIPVALTFHLPIFRDKYESIYTFLKPNISGLAQQMQDISVVFAEGDRAKYRIRRDQIVHGRIETITYYIYFSRDKDGLWKIERY